MKKFFKFSIFNAISCFLIMSPIALAETKLTASEVAKGYDDEFRHPTLSVQFKLSTCRYKIDQGQMRCTEKPRERVVENVLKAYGLDIRSVAILTEPISDRGIGMLGWQYWDKTKVNDYWMYLPALNKVKRIVSTKDTKDSGSYFGSEFYVEDLEGQRLEEYTYKLFPEEKISVLETGKGEVESPVYVVEWTPTVSRKSTTNYGRMVMWIDKKRFILMKGEYYDNDNALIKRRTIRNLELVDGKWMPRQVMMDNLVERRVTVMDRLSIAIGLPVDDDYFAQRTLTDEVYRENYLKKFRTYLKK